MGGSSALARRPPTLSAAIVKAECLSSDLRDVLIVSSRGASLEAGSFELPQSIWRALAQVNADCSQDIRNPGTAPGLRNDIICGTRQRMKRVGPPRPRARE